MLNRGVSGVDDEKISSKVRARPDEVCHNPELGAISGDQSHLDLPTSAAANRYPDRSQSPYLIKFIMN